MLGISKIIFIFAIVSTLFTHGCGSVSERASNGPAVNATNQPSNRTTTKANDDGTIPSGTGVEKEKPAAGKSNVQGKAMFNEKPAAGVEVKLCQTFSQFGGGCGGETFRTKTDAAGEYLIKDVTPGLYEGLTVQVFDTPFFVFATSGIMSAAKYNIEEGKTYFAPDTHLFKNDVKVSAPKAGAKIPPSGIEVKWDAYPDAAYYKMSIHGDSSSGAQTEMDFVSKRIDSTSFALDKPLTPGSYTTKIEAYNSNDRKLAQNSNDMKFTVTGGAK